MINSSSLRVAIIGAGPAGIYAAEALLKKQEPCKIDIIEALSSPYGLVRSGVAPDHFKIKEVSRQFEKVLSNEAVSFYGNVRVGEDVSIDELRMHYHAIILSHGTQKDRALGIPGEDLKRSCTATSFVGWYNSHPWFKDDFFDLSGENTVIIGQGNVAIDVTRILLKSPEDLHATDIGLHAEEALSESKIKNIYLIGRRGPLQIACTDKELKELGELPDVHIQIDPEELILTSEEEAWLESAPKGTRRNFELIKEFSKRPKENKPKTLHLKFFLSPLEIEGSDAVRGIRLVKNELTGQLDKRKAVPTTKTTNISCELLFRSVGYLGEGIQGVPFDVTKGTYPNEKGRISLNDAVLPGLYTSGWIKRGPSGVIGTNKADSLETVQSLIEDRPHLLQNPVKPTEELWENILAKGHRITDYDDWKKIELEERSRGQKIGKLSLKFRTQEEMLEFLSADKN
jgi:ferredoxin/flavodoxin---NADP+ reductase